MNLTELEKDVIVAIAENQYADNPESPVWSWAIVYDTKVVTKINVSGVVSSLVKKELVKTYPAFQHYDDVVQLTKSGVEQYHKIKED